jgi:stage II sporulation protein Q
MKRKVKLKYPFLTAIILIIPILIFGIFTNISNKEQPVETHPKEIITNSQPVIKENNQIINPYIDQSVKIGKKYYDYKGEESTQQESITVHDNTYHQNTGLDFISETEFDVVSIADGTVTNVKEDSTIGKSIEIKHDNGLISVYQSLSNITVKKDDIISQGQVIGKSGKNEFDNELGNHLHLEIYENGQSINPEQVLGKSYEKKN